MASEWAGLNKYSYEVLGYACFKCAKLKQNSMIMNELYVTSSMMASEWAVTSER